MTRRAHPLARAAGIALAASILISLSGCSFVSNLFGPTSSTPAATAPAWQSYLFMADTNSGKIYTYDPSTHAANATSLLSTGQNATGTINFYKGIGYSAVGYGAGAGVYWFDPAAANPVFTRLSTPSNTAINAQYFAFASTSLAYVSVAGDFTNDLGGIYTFNPSNLAAGLAGPIAGTDKYLQDIAIGPDGRVYAAENLDQQVLVYNPVNVTTTTIATSASGTTGIRAGTLNGNPGVFVANTGPFNPSTYLPSNGSIDFIPSNGATSSPVVPTSFSADFTPGRLIQLEVSSNLVATGNGHTWLITLSGSTASASEIKANGTSFGSLDLAEKNGLICMPSDATNYSVTPPTNINSLYVFDETGVMASYSPVSVMTSTDGFTNLAFYSN
ncbi:MAG TPA: hypothetical protein VMV83_00595 [Rectinemataceae bacterium]|nr:hypothetical protein [Rectinemataceae bacterium]